ncbi:MAG: hypothetical protein CM1200mP16_10660 [Nitrospina sp.]|nr:MAG: hypothetical protein CM1200mP16_10660 [Nitrospina sp.]
MPEYVRQSLARPNYKAIPINRWNLVCIDIGKRGIEDIIEGSIQKSETSAFLALEPNFAEKFLSKLRDMIKKNHPDD